MKKLKTYSKLSTEFYDLEPHINEQEASAFYMQKAIQANGPILEPMCGSGRFLIPILAQGLDAYGFDASQNMLDAFKEKYKQISSKKAPIWQEFVQDFNNKENKLYKLIFIPYGSWGLVTNLKDSQTGLNNLFNSLDNNGKLILEIETIASIPKTLGKWQYEINRKDNISKIKLNAFLSYNNSSQIFKSNSTYELIVDNKIHETEEEIFEQYIYKFDELEKYLQNTGFKKIKKYPIYDSSKIATEQTPIIIYECDK